MTLFNHEIEYLPIYRYDGLDELYDGMDIRAAIVSYDNLLGVRCTYRFDAPAHMWDTLKVGGMASTGGIKTIGVVSDIHLGSYSIQSATLGKTRHGVVPSNEQLEVGQQVMVFDVMEHTPGNLGEFTTMVTPRLDIAPNLEIHSIKVLIWQNSDHLGSVHIDPFSDVANHDQLELKFEDGEKWSAAHFSYKHL